MDVFTEIIALKHGEADPELEEHAVAKAHGQRHTLSLAAGVRKHMLREKHADLERTASRWVRKYRKAKDGWKVERAGIVASYLVGPRPKKRKLPKKKHVTLDLKRVRHSGRVNSI